MGRCPLALRNLLTVLYACMYMPASRVVSFICRDETYVRIKMRSDRTGRSVSSLIRAAVEDTYGGREDGKE